MNNLKNMLIVFRNGIAFSFSWLVTCVVVTVLFSGNQYISVVFLLKLLGLCAWGALSFSFCFANQKMQKKGFLFSLTLFYGLFIPVESILFYFTVENKKSTLWFFFAAIVVATYLVCIVIDMLIMRKKTAEYSRKIMQVIFIVSLQ